MLTIDDREQMLIEELRNQNIPHQVRHLSVGDITEGNCVIERKEAYDFIASIKDGRLINQCRNMKQYYERCFIVVHGTVTDVPTEMNTHAILGMLASISARANIPILMVGTITDAAYLIWKLLEKATDGKPFQTIFIKKSAQPDKRLGVLTLIDGVSMEKAKSIIKHYPTFKKLIDAPVKELTLIKGVGDKMAQRIESFFSIFRY